MDLTASIVALEKAHKCSLAQNTALKEELNLHTKWNFLLSHKLFNKHGNNSGRIVAKSL